MSYGNRTLPDSRESGDEATSYGVERNFSAWNRRATPVGEKAVLRAIVT